MFDNIGGKIKSLAKTIFTIEAVLSIIAGFILFTIDEDLIVYGFLTMILGPLAAWISSFILYGFGELVEKTCEIAENTRRL